jgi:hypothetical protein
MSYIEDVRSFLRKKNITYPDLLQLLIELERAHAQATLKISMGLRGDARDSYEDMQNAIKMGRIANRLKKKINKKLTE